MQGVERAAPFSFCAALPRLETMLLKARGIPAFFPAPWRNAKAGSYLAISRTK